EQASAAIRNIRNHLSVDPKAKIVVVTHAAGINFLLKDAQDKNGNPYEVAVQDLVSKGVDFRVCNFTLQSRHIDPKQVIEEAKIVPSGVAEVSRLQAQEGYAYLKP
ncbi:MAG: DsrE family protein, partial [Usitatibacter sp.]